MEIILVIFVFAIGVAVGFTIFYLRYEYREMIDQMRNHLSYLENENTHIKHDLEEIEQQNLILKKHTSELLIRNEDLSKLLSELNRYYLHIKDGYEQAKILVKTLEIFDKNFEQKAEKISIPTANNNTNIANNSKSIPINTDKKVF